MTHDELRQSRDVEIALRVAQGESHGHALCPEANTGDAMTRDIRATWKCECGARLVAIAQRSPFSPTWRIETSGTALAWRCERALYGKDGVTT